MQYFNIQVASQLSGVASPTIRAWEKRYHAVVPERGDNKHRLYTEKDIEKLALLSRLTEVGQSIGKIAHLGLEELKKVYSTLLHEPYNEKQVISFQQDRIDYSKILNNLYLALSSYKVDIIAHELDKACATLSPRDLCLRILIPLFREVGNRVEKGELNIVQEHTISALTSFYLGQMIGTHYQKVFHRDDLVLIGTPEDKLHEVGILAAALLCVHYGVRFIFMGTGLPHESISETANALKARAILLGATRLKLSEVKDFTQYLNDLQSGLTGRTEIWVGGDLEAPFKTELYRRKVPHFATLEAFDEFLTCF
jgi:DNA-binding transcriptional MerR regulator